MSSLTSHVGQISSKTMKNRATPWLSALIALPVALLLILPRHVRSQNSESEFCNTFASPYGYKCAEYKVATADGYVLVAHRFSLPPRLVSRPSVQNSQPVCVPTASQASETIDGIPSDLEKPGLTSRDQCHAAVDQLVISKADDPYLTAESYQGDGPNEGSNLATSMESPFRIQSADEEKLSVTNNLDRGRLASGGADRFVADPVQISQDRHLAGGFAVLHDHNGPVSSLPTAAEESPKSPRRHVSKKRGHSHHHTRASVGSGTLSISPAPVSVAMTSSGTHSPYTAPNLSQTQNSNSEIDQNPAPVNSDGPPNPPNQVSDRITASGSPVLLMHQEFVNADSWFQYADDTTDQLLPFLLLNSGFDVWIGHQRATYWAHDHVALTPDDQSYWNWTWDEHARYDMPALLELVMEQTGSAVHFVGVSQSATAGAATATMPQASYLIKSLTLVGPTIFRGNTSSLALDAWAFLFGNRVDKVYYDTGFQRGAFNFSSAFSSDSISTQDPIVSALLTAFSGPNCCLSERVLSFKNGWDGTTSFKNLLHYQQGIRTNSWRHFDYGAALKNSEAYGGLEVAPNYNPEDIPYYLPVLLIHGGDDSAAPPEGCRHFMSRLRSTSNSVVYLPSYGHYDLTYGFNRTQDVFMPVLRFLEHHRLD